ncbi:hypothetical protein U1Q18_032142 [Sarracenia purpurea var. burkii]
MLQEVAIQEEDFATSLNDLVTATKGFYLLAAWIFGSTTTEGNNVESRGFGRFDNGSGTGRAESRGFTGFGNGIGTERATGLEHNVERVKWDKSGCLE